MTQPPSPSDVPLTADSPLVERLPAGPADWRRWRPMLIAIAFGFVTLLLVVRGGVLSPDLRGDPGLSAMVVDSILPGIYLGMFDILLGHGLTLLAMAGGAVGWGACLRRLVFREMGWLACVTVGLGVMWLGMYGLALAGQAHALSAWGLIALGLAGGAALHGRAIASWVRRAKDQPLRDLPAPRWACVLVGPPVGLLLAAACCPPGRLWAVEAWGYDVLSYHLQIPREWLAAGRMSGLHHNVYSYLPSLVETGFLQLGAMRGSMYDATYTCQLLSVALMMLAAAHVGQLAHRLAGPLAGWSAAAWLLATPWVLVTGSMAYNESAVLAFGSAAMALTLDPSQDRAMTRQLWRRAAMVGVLLGLATLAKLTAGFMLAVPIGLLWALRLTGGGVMAWRRALALAGVVSAVGALTLTPYLARNALWTGNPVFPFAAKTLGQGHWDDALVDRWQRGHHVDDTWGQRLVALGQQWVCNIGYGAVGGRDRLRDPSAVESRNVAYFHRQWGVPTLLLAAGLGGVALLATGRHRRVALAMGLVLAVQVVAWLTATHLQSRFMIFSVLPMVVLAAVALGGLRQAAQARGPGRHLADGLAVLLVMALAGTGVDLLRHQVAGGQEGRPMWSVVDTLPTLGQALAPPGSASAVPTHPVNQLPPDSLTMLIADNSGLFYLHRPFMYHSAFDASPLGALVREHGGDPAAVAAALRRQGVTHLWIHGPELHRLRATYGFDPDVTPAFLGRLTGQAGPVLAGQVELYALSPGAGRAGAPGR